MTSLEASLWADERCAATLVNVCKIIRISSTWGVDRLHDEIRTHSMIWHFALAKYLQDSLDFRVVSSRMLMASYNSDIRRLLSTTSIALMVRSSSSDGVLFFGS